jgi:hypothetical protein
MAACIGYHTQQPVASANAAEQFRSPRARMRTSPTSTSPRVNCARTRMRRLGHGCWAPAVPRAVQCSLAHLTFLAALQACATCAAAHDRGRPPGRSAAHAARPFAPGGALPGGGMLWQWHAGRRQPPPGAAACTPALAVGVAFAVHRVPCATQKCRALPSATQHHGLSARCRRVVAASYVEPRRVSCVCRVLQALRQTTLHQGP